MRAASVETIYGIIAAHAERAPEALAVLAPGRAPLTYARLRQRIAEIVQALNTLGVGRGDRVAVVLPAGADMALTMLGVLAGAVAVPLNPALRSEEFAASLANLKAQALIVQQGRDSPAVEVARRRGLQLIELVPTAEGEAGFFTLHGAPAPPPRQGGFAEPSDIALVMQTSGTTTRPKIVAQAQTVLLAKGRGLTGPDGLIPQDRLLAVLPLFYSFGTNRALICPLVAGSSVAYTSGFSAPDFFAWLGEFRPTWYAATPAMHQAILDQVQENRTIIARSALRFILTSGAALSRELLAELERVFHAPVIEYYGMTEMACMLAVNPLPPGRRKHGSVGRVIESRLAIMAEDDHLLPTGQTGEVVVGAAYMIAYEDDPEANRQVFRDGWFHTGDLGYIDEDGYLFITGRVKEVINRGGEKVSPGEVEEVLRRHSAVAEAVTFAQPHAALGEEVAAAVVLRPGAAGDERQLRAFAAQHLAGYKVPGRIVFLTELPKGPTGKVQRRDLAERLGLSGPPAGQASYVAPRTPVEEALASIWAEVLGIERVGVHDDFGLLGGHSLQAADIVARLRTRLGVELDLAHFATAATVAAMAQIIAQTPALRPAGGEAASAEQTTALKGIVHPSVVVPMQTHGSRPPFFAVHAGPAFLFYRDLVRHLGADQPFYVLRDPDPYHPAQVRLEEMAARYVRAVRALQPEGPYYLGGYCFGGAVAFEMAQQLHAQGQKVALLALVEIARSRETFWQRMRLHLDNLALLGTRGKLEYLLRKGQVRWRLLVRALVRRGYRWAYGRDLPYVPHSLDDKELRTAYSRMRRAYSPQVYPGRLTVFRGTGPQRTYLSPTLGWEGMAAGGLEVHAVPGGHVPVDEPHVRVLAEKLGACLVRAQSRLGKEFPG